MAQKGGGLTRNELIHACKLQTGGGTTQILEELRESGFIGAYIPFGKTSKDAVFKLIDEFSLFHTQFMADNKLHGRGSWTVFSSKPIWAIWCGIAFEHLCLKHIDPIKYALGIHGVHSEHYVWCHKPKEGERGAQIDLLIDRNDQCINICELKFTTTAFELSKKYALELQNKRDVFQLQTKTRKALFLTMVTTYGLQNRKSYPGLIQSEVTVDALFQKPN